MKILGKAGKGGREGENPDLKNELKLIKKFH